MADQWEIFDARQNPDNGSILTVHFRITDSVTGNVTKTTIELDQSSVGAEYFIESPTRDNLIQFITDNAKAEMTSHLDDNGEPLSLWDYWANMRAKAPETPVKQAFYDGVEYDRVNPEEPEA